MGRKTTICLCTTAATAAVAALCLVVLILAFTVFKPKHPITTVDSIAISDLRFKINLPKLRVHINLTLAVAVAVKNPNPVKFRYDGTTAFLRYRGKTVGEAPVPAGVIGGRAARRLNLSLTLMADQLLSQSDFYSDAISGTLPLQTDVRVPGKVRLLFGAKVVAHATCDLEVHLVSRSLVNQTCRYNTKL